MSVKMICRACWGMTYVDGHDCQTCNGQGEITAGDSVWTDAGKATVPTGWAALYRQPHELPSETSFEAIWRAVNGFPPSRKTKD